MDHHSSIFLIGSCFVENIGHKLDWFRFRNLQNPTGILFHPHVIGKFLYRVAEKRNYTAEDIFEFQGRWQSYEAHSRVSGATMEECLLRLNSGLEKAEKFLSAATHVVVTLGTAWYYRHLATGSVVANCHKVPQKEFKKQLSSVKELQDDLQFCMKNIRRINPDCSVIFTVSPVRHIKDGVVENSLGKAQLLTAVHQIVRQNSYNFYFPAYEIMMDELRDYRFYSQDMIHPSNMAIEYIWNRFTDAWLAPESSGILREIDSIQKARHHRLPEELSGRHKKFLTKLQLKIEEIQKKHPEISFSEPA